MDKDKRQVFIEPQCFDVMDGDLCYSVSLEASTASLEAGTAFPSCVAVDSYLFTWEPRTSPTLFFFSRLYPPCQPLEGTAFAFP